MLIDNQLIDSLLTTMLDPAHRVSSFKSPCIFVHGYCSQSVVIFSFLTDTLVVVIVVVPLALVL